jgi:hypothetical protein
MDFSLMARSMAASAGKKRCIRERPALRPRAAPRGVRLPGRARQPEPAKPHRQLLRLLERPQPPRVAASVSLGPTSRLVRAGAAFCAGVEDTRPNRQTDMPGWSLPPPAHPRASWLGKFACYMWEVCLVFGGRCPCTY